MTVQTLMQEILQKHPLINQEMLQEKLKSERERTCGLLSDETLLRLIAAKYGVVVQQNEFHISGILPSNRLCVGLNDVSVCGRLFAVFPAKTFQGAEKTGKFATLMLADGKGLLRVVLWDSKAEMVERGDLKVGHTVRLMHGYTKEDRYGKTELHMGSKSQIQIENQSETTDNLSIEKLVAKIQSLSSNSGSVHLCGQVKAVLGKKAFPRSDESDGMVMRLAFRDDSGEVTLVVWNEKVSELEVILRDSPRLLIINAKVKETPNGGLEVHVDSGTALNSIAPVL
jgi:replication factor A1